MKKLMFYVLPFLLVLSLFGCTNSEETGDLPEILIGSDTYPPYLYFDNNGNPTGIDVDIAVEAFRRLGYKATLSILIGKIRRILWIMGISIVSGAVFLWMAGKMTISGLDHICILSRLLR